MLEKGRGRGDTVAYRGGYWGEGRDTEGHTGGYSRLMCGDGANR
jgi:hypothetical protein